MRNQHRPMLIYRFIGLLAQAGADLSVYRFIGLLAQAGADLSVYRFIGLSAQAGKNRPCHHAAVPIYIYIFNFIYISMYIMYSCSWKGGFLWVGNMHNIPRVRIFLHQQYIALRYMLYCALSYNQSAMLGAHIKSVIMNINATLSKCQMCVSCRSTVFWMWYSGNLWVSYDVPLFQISSELYIPLTMSNHCGISRYPLLFIWLVWNSVAALGFPVQTWWKFGPAPPMRNKQNMITHTHAAPAIIFRMFQISQAVLFQFFFIEGWVCVLVETGARIACYKDIGIPTLKSFFGVFQSTQRPFHCHCHSLRIALQHLQGNQARKYSNEQNLWLDFSDLELEWIRNVESRICTSIEGQSFKSISNATSGSIQLLQFLEVTVLFVSVSPFCRCVQLCWILPKILGRPSNFLRIPKPKRTV